jgi:ribose 5-phosphate isomerase B
MKVYIAGDKHGLDAIKIVEEYLKANNIEFENIGAKNKDEEIKLENMIPAVTKNVLQGNLGILSCGTGIGVEIGANKFSGIRACLATDEKIAEWSKVYDNCNILCLVGWGANSEKIIKILDAWFNSKYDGSEKRLKMFKEFDRWH